MINSQLRINLISFFFSLPQRGSGLQQSKSRLPSSTIPTIPTVSKHFWTNDNFPCHNRLDGTFFEPRKSQNHDCKVTKSRLQSHKITTAKSQNHDCTPNQHSQLDGCHSQLGIASISEFNGIKGITFFIFGL